MSSAAVIAAFAIPFEFLARREHAPSDPITEADLEGEAEAGLSRLSAPSLSTGARRDVSRSPSMAGPLPPYTLRRSARSRHLRVTIDPALGVVVTVPPATRRGWAHPEATIERFLRERETWLRRHLERIARQQAELAARGGVRDGATIRYRGELHRIRVRRGAGRATIERRSGRR